MGTTAKAIAETGSLAADTSGSLSSEEKKENDRGKRRDLPELEVAEKKVPMDTRIPAAAMNGSAPRNVKGRKAMLQRNLAKGKKHQRFDSGTHFSSLEFQKALHGKPAGLDKK